MPAAINVPQLLHGLAQSGDGHELGRHGSNESMVFWDSLEVVRRRAENRGDRRE